MNDSSSNQARMPRRSRSRRRKKARENAVFRFTQAWSEASKRFALELFGCDFSSENRKLQFGLLLAMVVSFLFFIGTSVRPILATRWSQGTGTVIENKLIFLGSGRNKEARRIVVYEYLAGDRVYQGGRVDFSMSGSWDWAGLLSLPGQSWLPQKGERVTVHFDPSKPQNAVLNPSPPWTEILVSFFVLSFSAFFSGEIIHSIVQQVTDFFRPGKSARQSA